MVKLALILRFLRIEKVLKCCVNFALWLSSYMIFCLEFHFQLKVNFWLLIQVILSFAGKVTLTICMFYTINSCMIFTLHVFNTLKMIAYYSYCLCLTPCNDCMLFTLCVFNTLQWINAIYTVCI